MSDEATYELDGHIATITYNRPESLNAINGAMRECLNAAWLEFYNDPEAWVAVLTGAGRAFVPGLTYGRDGVTLQVAGREVTLRFLRSIVLKVAWSCGNRPSLL